MPETISRIRSLALTMLQLLLMGISTRPMVCSAFSLSTHRRPPTTCMTRLLATNSSSSSSSTGRVSNAVSDSATQSTAASSKAKKTKKQQQISTQPVKGTRDFYPPAMRQREWLFGEWKTVARMYGFDLYDAPLLESAALYTRKAGEEVTQQLYTLTDQSDRQLALRPEMTPSLARMVLQQQNALPLPLKYASIPQCWRYERMTRGRRREHYQWNMDIWGVAGVAAEVELLSAMVAFCTRVGLTHHDVGISVNSRLVISEVLTGLGIPPEKFAATCVLVDKLEKVPIEAVQSDLEDLGLTKSVVEELLQVLSAKTLSDLQAALGKQKDSEAIAQLTEFFALCEQYGLSDWVLLDASVVRGLAYYTGIVFEAFDRKGELRAIAGGGRYDTLLTTYGAKTPIPAAGFGFGDAVIVELLKERKLLPSFAASGVDTVVFAMNASLYAAAIEVAKTLRGTGQSVDLVLEQKKPKWVFKHADRLQAKHCVVIGETEFADGKVAIKDLESGEQITAEMDGLEQWAAEQRK